MQTFIIGRDAGSQIVLSDKLVSRLHAQLTFLDSGQVTIKDLGSVNGTFVNGNRITECYLNAGDIVKCGPSFLNWAQYLTSGNAAIQPMNYQQAELNPDILQEGDSTASNQYNAGDVFMYLTTRIFEIGDLFKTSWDRTYSILILYGTPVILTLIVSIIAYFKNRYLGFYFSPTILTGLSYAVSPFIAMYLLSINRKVQIDKVALASGIIGFIQFCIGLCFGFCFLIFYQNFSAGFRNPDSLGFYFFVLVVALLLLVVLVNLIIALYLSIYKYFIAVGITRSKSIYLIVITIALIIFFNVLSIYAVILFEKNTPGKFNF